MKFCALVLTGVFFAASLFAQKTPGSIAVGELPSLLTIDKDAHQHSELPTHERRASERIAKEGKAATARFSTVARNFATACLLVE